MMALLGARTSPPRGCRLISTDLKWARSNQVEFIKMESYALLCKHLIMLMADAFIIKQTCGGEYLGTFNCERVCLDQST